MARIDRGTPMIGGRQGEVAELTARRGRLHCSPETAPAHVPSLGEARGRARGEARDYWYRSRRTFSRARPRRRRRTRLNVAAGVAARRIRSPSCCRRPRRARRHRGPSRPRRSRLRRRLVGAFRPRSRARVRARGHRRRARVSEGRVGRWDWPLAMEALVQRREAGELPAARGRRAFASAHVVAARAFGGPHPADPS